MIRPDSHSLLRIVATLLLSLAAALTVGGCQEQLIATPYVMYGEAGKAVYARVPETLRTSDLPVLYVTDRQVKKETPEGPRYGYGRSPGMEFGVATVSLGTDIAWDQLVADSTGSKRSRAYTPKVASVERTGGFASLVTRIRISDGRLTLPGESIQAVEDEQHNLDKLVDRWLDHSERKEAVIFIHGFNNSFDDAVIRLAEAWHFTGRQGVPVVFTWPAGSPGLLSYAQDRESGEFANMHLKLLLVSLARNPKIEKIHIISHSRGTDVATTALRELHTEIRAGQGHSIFSWMLGLQPLPKPGSPEASHLTCDALKLQTLVLAAPDLDIEVFGQRFFGDNVLNVAKRVIIYLSNEDSALGLSDWLFSSKARVGNVDIKSFKPEFRAALAGLSDLEVINCKVSGGSSHSYVMQHPAALSDLILALRECKDPGAENGRPLAQPYKGVWQMDNSYLKPKE